MIWRLTLMDDMARMLCDNALSAADAATAALKMSDAAHYHARQAARLRDEYLTSLEIKSNDSVKEAIDNTPVETPLVEQIDSGMEIDG